MTDFNLGLVVGAAIGVIALPAAWVMYRIAIEVPMLWTEDPDAFRAPFRPIARFLQRRR